MDHHVSSGTAMRNRGLKGLLSSNLRTPVCFCGGCSPAATPATAVLSAFQTPCMSPSTSLRAHRSCPSTAGMGTLSSSTSMCQKTLCCFAGSCKRPGGKDLSAPTWRSQCMYVPVPVLAHVGFLPFSCPCCSWLWLVVCRRLGICSPVAAAIVS